MVILDGVVEYGFSTVCGRWVVICIASVGVNWMDIWDNCGLVGLGVEESLVSAIGKIIIGGGGVSVGS